MENLDKPLKFIKMENLDQNLKFRQNGKFRQKSKIYIKIEIFMGLAVPPRAESSRTFSTITLQ